MNAKKLTIKDKYTGEEIGSLPVSSDTDVDNIIAKAREAYLSFSHEPAHRRSAILASASVLIDKNKEEIATTICREAGKAWKYSVAEVARAAETFQFASEEAKRIHGETVPMDASASGEGRLGFYIRSPIGVVAAITPFNFPLNLVAHKVAPAIAAGNTIVLKPASSTPLTAIRLGEILKEADLPEGVFNIVIGPGSSIGDQIVEDPRIAKISFTGSASVGEAITKKAGLKKITMELGNNSATIVEPDVNMDDAVPRCAMSAFANSGQVCISLQRLYLHKSIAADFTKRLIDATLKLKIGNPLDKDCDVGPMIDEAEAIRAEGWIKEAVAGGAKILAGGKREGSVLYPTILTNVRPEMKVVSREVFAPVVCIIEYDDFDDALRMASDTSYGLQAGIYTKDISKALRAIDRLDVGGVMINDTSIFRADHMPYGGNKMSGIGREGVRFAIEEMTNIKMVVIKS